MSEPMSLTRKQFHAVEALMWLLDPDARREGRSTAMAQAFFSIAVARPGEWVQVWDHYDPREHLGQQRMLDMVAGLIPERHREKFEVDRQRGRLMFKGSDHE